jgi:predicted ATP-grasp superfamily ATP-dependent carboligase
MGQERRILVFGASARAAAFSALRAGLVPWCADLFADRDLERACEVVSVRGAYPGAFRELLRSAPSGPWMYTGALENHTRLVGAMSRARELWGNDPAVLKSARDPFVVADALRAAGLACPAVSTPTLATATSDSGMPWLLKPLRGAGGRGISFWRGGSVPRGRTRYYLQEFMSGSAAAALFVGDGRSARFLGLTGQILNWPDCRTANLQMIADPLCDTPNFEYRGSMTLWLELSPTVKSVLQCMGDVLTAAFQLRGLFGVDGVLRREEFWPVEVNPRYTASVEVLEYAAGLRALVWHRAAFDPTAPEPSPPGRCSDVVAKVILMARQDFVFPRAGPWDSALRNGVQVHQMPDFADIPRSGERIKAGRPILTVFARAADPIACYQEIQSKAVDLDQWLCRA